MRFVSLFSGIGGIDLGLERAGMKCVGQVENDPWCNQILEKHWPTVPRWQDIHDLNPKELPDHDLIAGGFPCQPVSLAGARQAQDDPRWLWPEFFRIVRMVRPRYVVVENVPGLASAGMGDVLGDLASSGYDCEWQSIPAAFVGAPHLRWRIFIVAYPSDVRPPRPEQARSDSGKGGGRDTIRPRTTRRSTDAAHSDSESEPGVTFDAGPRPGELVLADPDSDSIRNKSVGFRWGNSSTFSTDSGEDRTMVDAAGIRYRTPQILNVSWRTESGSWWSVEPDVGRVADGIPRRVDRLKGLGNAVVPQVAELVGRMIMDADRVA